MKVIRKSDKENLTLYKKLYKIEFGKDLSPFHLVVGTDGIPAKQGCEGDPRLHLRDGLLTSGKLVVVAEETTDPKHGYEPEKRPIKVYLNYGLIPLDKTRGPTSHEVVAWVRRLLGGRRTRDTAGRSTRESRGCSRSAWAGPRRPSRCFCSSRRSTSR